MSNKNNNQLNDVQFVLGKKDNRIYIGHFEKNEDKTKFVPDSDDMTDACISIVALMMNRKCKEKKTDTYALTINDIGVLHFGNENFLNEIKAVNKNDENKRKVSPK